MENLISDVIFILMFVLFIVVICVYVKYQSYRQKKEWETIVTPKLEHYEANKSLNLDLFYDKTLPNSEYDSE